MTPHDEKHEGGADREEKTGRVRAFSLSSYHDGPFPHSSNVHIRSQLVLLSPDESTNKL